MNLCEVGRGNQKPKVKRGQKIQWPKEKRTKLYT